jgi:beta-N-acetylhexosaminidase
MAVNAFICGCSGTSLTAEERAFLREAQPWGFILFARNIASADQVRALCHDFRSLVGRDDAPVLIDQEGGRVRRLRPPLVADHPAVSTYGALHSKDPDAARALTRLAGRVLGAELHALGVTVDCAPVLDLRYEFAHDIIGDRAFGGEPEVVADLGRALGEGLEEAGVLPVVKHIPGHGRALADSHFDLPEVDAGRDILEETCFAPFRAYADAPLAMTAHVVYRAIDPEAPATTSRRVIEEVIRDFIGFDGLLMSDDVSMKALKGPIRARTEAAIAAGCDMALHCNGDLLEMTEVATASPRLAGRAAERAEAALARIAARNVGDIADQREALEAFWRTATA